jgi:hypothetical protein
MGPLEGMVGWRPNLSVRRLFCRRNIFGIRMARYSSRPAYRPKRVKCDVAFALPTIIGLVDIPLSDELESLCLDLNYKRIAPNNG